MGEQLKFKNWSPAVYSNDLFHETTTNDFFSILQTNHLMMNFLFKYYIGYSNTIIRLRQHVTISYNIMELS